VETPIEDALYLWCLYQCPILLEDQQVFNGLLQFIHRLTRAAAKAERDRLGTGPN